MSQVLFSCPLINQEKPIRLVQTVLGWKKKKILFVITEEYSDIFEKDEKFLKFKLINKFNGFNYSQGKNVEFKIFIN